MILKPGIFIENAPGITVNETPASPVRGNSVSPAAYNSSLPAVPQVNQLASETLKSVALGLGFPADVLSLSLLAFSRFFSIPPIGELLSSLRKELLAFVSSSPKTGKERAALEAKALAALAVLDKGVVLSGERLEAYGAVPEPDKPWQGRVFKGEFDAEDLSRFFGNSGSGSQKNPGEDEDDRCLDFLNAIPGKNGQRWIVFPFNYKSEGIELRVLVRILVKDSLESQVMVDVSGPKRSWRFILDKARKKAAVSIVPGLAPGELASIKRILRALDFLEIRIVNGEALPFAEELGKQDLPSVNKAV